jgi:hypothetical protein
MRVMAWAVLSGELLGVCSMSSGIAAGFRRFPFFAVGPDRDAGAFEHLGEASAAFPDYPVLVVRKLVADNLGTAMSITAERFKRTE